MTTQGININVQDGGLGQTPPGLGNVLAVVGVASGTGQTNKPITTSNPAAILTNNGYGPGPQAAALVINDSGNPVIFVQAATVTNGTVSAVQGNFEGTSTLPGGSTTVMTVTGTPLDTYYLRVQCSLAGTVGTGPVQILISLDYGRTWLYTINLGTSTSYAIPNTGLTLNFSVGTFVLGDFFWAFCKEPLWSDASVASAVQSLYGYPTTFLDILVVGDAASGDCTSFGALLPGLANVRKYTTFIGNARDALWGGASTETEFAWMSAIQTDYASVSIVNGGVGISAGHYNVISPIDQSQYRRPLSWLAAARDSAVAIQVDLGRVSDGALAPMVLPASNPSIPNSPSGDGFIYHDESVNPGLDASRFMACWSLATLPGLYIKNPNLMAGAGSDYNWLQHRHVIMSAAQLAYAWGVQKLSGTVRVSAQTGFILEVDRQKLQNGLQSSLNTNLVQPGAVSSITVTVSGTDNILTTSTISVTIAVVPLGYIKAINITILFVNPAIAAVQTQAGG
jgi:hypothetical protein